MAVPEPILNKAPPAGPLPGLAGEDSPGFTYEEVDQLLYLLVDERYAPEEAVAAGFSAEFVRAVRNRVQQAHYKRELPVIPKISDRTVGHDFRYLRDWGT
jgi:NAD+ synthase